MTMSTNASTNQLPFDVVETEKQQTQDDKAPNQTEVADLSDTESGDQTESASVSERDSSPETLTYKGPAKPVPYVSIFQPLRPQNELTENEAIEEEPEDKEESCESEAEYLPTTQAPPLMRKTPPLSFKSSEKDAAKPSVAAVLSPNDAPKAADGCDHCDCGHSHDEDIATVVFNTAKQTASDVFQAVGARVRSHGITK